MPNIVILPYEAKYCSDIIDLFYNTVHAINAQHYTQAQRDVWAPQNIDKNRWHSTLANNYALVAIVDDALAGFADVAGSGYLDRLYVHKNCQHIGVATALVDALEQHCIENSVLNIETHASITAKPFFEKRGYKVVKEQTVERGGQFLTNFVMVKHLV